MPIPIAEAIEKLRASTSRLNKATEELSHVVQVVEVFLEANNVGCFASVVVSEETEEQSGYTYYTELTYSKIGKHYRICIQYSSDVEPNTTEKPWSDSSREEKVLSAPFIPDLLVELTTAVEKQEQKVKETTSKVKLQLAPLFQSKAGALK